MHSYNQITCSELIINSLIRSNYFYIGPFTIHWILRVNNNYIYLEKNIYGFAIKQEESTSTKELYSLYLGGVRIPEYNGTGQLFIGFIDFYNTSYYSSKDIIGKDNVLLGSYSISTSPFVYPYLIRTCDVTTTNNNVYLEYISTNAPNGSGVSNNWNFTNNLWTIYFNGYIVGRNL